ncbi:hypothetical protein [Amycolatopsis suaedae]|uniref:LPXTG cell wall anchor domain-containing protein n=1 Tax=Amycolatopsis suaedae TaxID=2510978 RepID=A0A4Q7J0T9_9PSEU|nr:hypothetical protein [Amycolatopsis suaedae]RZQ60348.1 hypothetical protein EWH70_29025 [Amycolatopsis suaedae]
MTTRLLAAAAVSVTALLALPGASAAQTPVDERTGPVSFANAIAVRVGEGPQAGTVITETQKSPTTPGQSRLTPSRNLVPRDAGERKALGENYLVHLGQFAAPGPYPDGVGSRAHAVTAALRQDTVPAAVAETNYALQDQAIGGDRPIDNTVLAMQRARTSVECARPGALTASSTVDRLWVRTDTGLDQVSVPEGSTPLSLKGLPFGPPTAVPGIDKDKTTSDLTIRRVTRFDELLRQDQWRAGDATAVGGWLVEIVSHVVRGDGQTADVKTRMVLGGVSCSVPKNFSGAAAPPAKPKVPTKVPAGTDPGGDDLLGYGLLGTGAVLGVAAVAVLRRRRPPA